VRLTTVFNKLLSLQGALVRDVTFEPTHLVVTVARTARKHRCPRCRYATHGSYDEHVASWRHLALGKWAVLVRATLKRIACPEHGVITEAVPWALPGARFGRREDEEIEGNRDAALHPGDNPPTSTNDREPP
jgi:transposase